MSFSFKQHFLSSKPSTENMLAPKHHHISIRLLHCLIATMIFAALVMSTFVMSRLANDDPQKITGLMRHMGVGMLILICTLLRRFMRNKHVPPSPISTGMPWADWMASMMHRALDVLVFVMIASGIGMAIVFKLPSLVIAGQGALPASLDNHVLHSMHVFGASVLAFLVFVHIAGALFHQFVLKDGLMSRMGFAQLRRRGQ